ncbi:MAG: hypothetical protein ABL889_11815 [Terricaulis sp.]
MDELNIAEIPFEDGGLQYRYARYLADDGQRWLRHGLFQAFYPTGTLKSEGTYQHGLEHGAWRDFHSNGQIAAEGQYQDGVEVGEWRFWDAAGKQEDSVTY